MPNIEVLRHSAVQKLTLTLIKTAELQGSSATSRAGLKNL
jgi:hypothetical protein